MDSDSATRAEVRTFVKEQWNALSVATEGQEKLSVLQNIASLLPTSNKASHPYFMDDVSLKKARINFAEEHYGRVAENLLDLITVDWVANIPKQDLVKSLDEIFLKGIPSEAFSLLCSTTYKCGASYRQNKCVEWLVSLLRGGVLETILLEQVEYTSNKDLRVAAKRENWDDLIGAISSLPDRMATSLKQQNSEAFEAGPYLDLVGQSLVLSLEKCHRLLMAGRDCSLEFSSRLLGKLCLLGHGEVLWSQLLGPLLSLVKRDYVWWRLSERLIAGVPDRCLEPVLIPLLSAVPWYGTVERLLGDSVLHSQKIRYILTTKLLLMRHFEETRLLQNVIGYLSSSQSRKALFKSCLLSVLKVWGDGSALRHTSYQQHLYLSKALIVSLSFIPESDRADYKHDCLQELMRGMQHHLNSPDVKIRSLDMLIAESFTKTLDPSGPQLNFEFEKDDNVKELLPLLIAPVDPGVQHLESELPGMAVSDGAPSSRGDERGGTEGEDLTGSGDADLDSDDDLVPFDLSNDTRVSKVKKPHYIRDCMEGLISPEDPDQTEVCLTAAEPLIRSHPDGLEEISAELMKVLLHLSDCEAVTDFRGLRYRAMVALTVLCPKQVAPYLTSEFYGVNYNLRQRLDILEVISAAAQELSSPVKTDKAAAFNSQVDSPLHSANEPESWKEIVERRIAKKTRRFGKGRSQPEPVGVANKFSPVAGLFFFPLLLQYDRRQNTLDLLGEDTVVLARLLYTVGTVIHAAINTQIVRQMGAVGLEFVWALRYHQDGSVRLAVLFCCAMLFLSVPPHFLLSELQAEVTELKLWLQDVVERDVKEDCRTLAAQVILLFEGAVKQEFHAGVNS